MFGHLGLRDPLLPYLGSQHALRCTSSELRAAYDYGGLFTRLQGAGSEFITLPSNLNRLDAVLAGIMRKGLFLMELADLRCFYEVVYGAEEDRRAAAARFQTLQPHVAACVETVFIDCHWIGYVSASRRDDDLWMVSSTYGNDVTCAPFDRRAFRDEICAHLRGWTNLQQIVLYAPRQTATSTFLSVVYEETKRAVATIKLELDNPHHVKIIEVRNDGIGDTEYARRSIAFFENARPDLPLCGEAV